MVTWSSVFYMTLLRHICRIHCNRTVFRPATSFLPYFIGRLSSPTLTYLFRIFFVSNLCIYLFLDNIFRRDNSYFLFIAIFFSFCTLVFRRIKIRRTKNDHCHDRQGRSSLISRVFIRTHCNWLQLASCGVFWICDVMLPWDYRALCHGCLLISRP